MVTHNLVIFLGIYSFLWMIHHLFSGQNPFLLSLYFSYSASFFLLFFLNDGLWPLWTLQQRAYSWPRAHAGLFFLLFFPSMNNFNYLNQLWKRTLFGESEKAIDKGEKEWFQARAWLG